MNIADARRLLGMVMAATLLASLVVVTTAPSVAAQPMCHGKVATIVGTPGDDDLAHGAALFGSGDDDVIVGLGGNDDIFALNGNDTVCGGGGEDNIEGGPGNDLLDGGGKTDRIDGGDGDDFICGGFGNDILKGGTGASSGDDTIHGGPGFDRIFGGWGQDNLYGYLPVSSASDCPGRGRDRRDIIKGNAHDDYIFGGPGNDDLFGGGGHDVINAGRNNDDMDGGPGTDDCRQNQGTGKEIRCEVANLAVKVLGVGSPLGPDFSFTVKVWSVRGNSSYTLYVSENNGGTVNCNFDGEDEELRYGRLPGKPRYVKFDVECDGINGGSQITISAEVETDAHDPARRNNYDDKGPLTFES